MKTIKGDLIKLAIDDEFDVIVHGCNCFNSMGGGIAKQIKTIFPEAYDADLESIKGDKSKLGTYTSATINKITVINAYTQYAFWGQELLVDYDAINSVFLKIKEDFHDKRIGIPMIGAGLAGGDWDIIENIIVKIMNGVDITLVLYEAKNA